MKITFSQKQIDELAKSIRGLQTSISQSKDDLSSYTRFLYKLHNDFYGKDLAVSDVKLFAKADDIAESLSTDNLVQMLAMKLEELIEQLRIQQVTQTRYIIELNKAKLAYQQAWISLKAEMEQLDQQKTHMTELLWYLQISKDEASKRVGNLSQSKELLEDQINQLYKLTTSGQPLLREWSQAYELLQSKDRDVDSRYFSWPVIWDIWIKYYFNDPFYLEAFAQQYEHMYIVADQGDAIYAPAPWIVYKVIESEDLNVSWMILLHKQGYMSVYEPLSEVYVKEWDIVARGEIIASVGGQPGTNGAWLVSEESHLVFAVLQNGEAMDPLDLLDVSIFNEEILPQKYHVKYLNDFFAREVDLSGLPEVAGNTIDERKEDWLRRYAIGPYQDPALRFDAARETWINPIFGLCVWFAETSYKHFKSAYNIGNVGNNDRWETVAYNSPIEWAKALFHVLNNQYLGWYYTINELSRFGNIDGYIYASSPFNRQKNVMKCMSTIYGYAIPEDFPFRVVE